MKNQYNDTTDGNLTNNMNERFLIWTNRNYLITMDTRLKTPLPDLGDHTIYKIFSK